MTDDGDTTSNAEAREPFSAKLVRLIATVHPPDRDRYSYREISTGVEERTGVKVSPTYLNQLATGERKSPSLTLADALATFFGVPLNYFTDDAATARIDAQLEQLGKWRDTESRALAERVMNLDKSGRGVVGALMDSLEEYEAQPRETRKRRKPNPPGA